MNIKKAITSLIVPVLMLGLSGTADAASKELVIQYNANQGSASIVKEYEALNNGNIVINKDGRLYGFRQEISERKVDLVDAESFGLHRRGYEFNGWSTSPDGGTVFSDHEIYSKKDISPNIKKNDVHLVLYANWKPVVHKAVFDTGDGEHYETEYSIEDAIRNIGTPEKEGYTFDGWKASGKNNWRKTAVYTSEDIEKAEGRYGDVLFTARWKVNVVRFKYDFGGAKPAVGKITSQVTDVQEGFSDTVVNFETETVNFPDPQTCGYSNPGYKFTGWNTKSDGTGVHIDAGTTDESATRELFNQIGLNIKNKVIKLYAQWEKTDITITCNITGDVAKEDFSVDENGNLMSSITNLTLSNSVEFDKLIVLPTSSVYGLTKKGYILKGWKSDQTGKIYEAGESVQAFELLKSLPSEDKTVVLSTVWEANLLPLKLVLQKNFKKVVSQCSEDILEELGKHIPEENLPEKAESGKYGDYNVDVINSLKFAENDSFLQSYVVACYLVSTTGKSENINQTHLADIDYDELNEKLEKILTSSFTYTTDVEENQICIEVNKFDTDKIAGCFRLSGEEKSKAEAITEEIEKLLFTDTLYCPMTDEKAELISGYGWKTSGSFNCGIDVSIKNGTLLYSQHRGVLHVLSASSGYTVSVDYGNGVVYRYGGLKKIFCEDGDKLHFGEVFGETSGSLHIEILIGGEYIAPDNIELLKKLNVYIPFANIENHYRVDISRSTLSSGGVIWVASEKELLYYSGTADDQIDKDTDLNKKFPDLKGRLKYISPNRFSLTDEDGKQWIYYNTEVYKLMPDCFTSPFENYSSLILTSAFGYRTSINGRTSTYHRGIDICVEGGTLNKTVNTVADGIVTISGFSAYGNYVVVDHGNGFSTLYAHLNSRAVSAGQKVKQGDVIGYAGSTYGPGGYSTGPHLHFELRINDEVVNPIPYIPSFETQF